MQKATVGGILALVGSILGALLALVLLALPALIQASNSLADYDVATLRLIQAVYMVMGIGLLLVCVLGIVGGIFALRRRSWGLALAGAIASSLAFYPLGIGAVVLVSMARPEFTVWSMPPALPVPAPPVP
jgi:hypothetical protein